MAKLNQTSQNNTDDENLQSAIASLFLSSDCKVEEKTISEVTRAFIKKGYDAFEIIQKELTPKQLNSISENARKRFKYLFQ